DLRGRGLLGDVGPQEPHGVPGVGQFALVGGAGLLVDVDEEHRGALVDEGGHDRAADAAGAAGDDRALTGKPDTHLISFVMEKSRGGGHRQPDARRPATTDPGWGHSMVKASFSSAAIEYAE